MKKFILLNSILLLLVSCNGGKEYHYIPDNQKFSLKDNDTVLFLDSLNNRVDSFRLSVNSYFNVSEDLGYQHIQVHYLTLNKRKSFKYFSTNQSIDFEIVDIDYNYNFWNNPSTATNYSLHGVVYPKVFVDYEKYLPDTIPNTVYYTYQDGILRYDYKDGRHYDRIKK